MGEPHLPSSHPSEPSSESPSPSQVSFRVPLEIPEDHPILYANRVNVVGSDSEVFLDFFLVDGHTGQGGLKGRVHFVSRIALSVPAVKSLSDMLQPALEIVESRRKG